MEGAVATACSKALSSSSLWLLRLTLNHDRHGETERLAVDARLIALNDAPLLERADAAGDGRGRKRDALGELDLALAAVSQQGSKNGTIQRIELNFRHFPASLCALAQLYCNSLAQTLDKTPIIFSSICGSLTPS